MNKTKEIKVGIIEEWKIIYYGSNNKISVFGIYNDRIIRTSTIQKIDFVTMEAITMNSVYKLGKMAVSL